MYWWQYLLLVNLYLILFYGFYAILLRMETFFNLNRAYLVASALLSFFIPLVHYEWVSRLFITQRVQQTISIYARPISVYQHQSIPAEQQVTIGNLIFLVYATGILFLVIRLAGQMISLRRIIDQPESTTAFSFFNRIRLDRNAERSDIIEAHEMVHARQWHSVDVLLIEFIAIINWFNPIVYIYKKGIKHIHEFIADRQALNSGTSKSEYALLLLSQTLEAPAHDLVNTFFNTSLLKRRILMLQKSRSTYMALLKYGLSAPLFMVMLVLSSATIIKSHTIRFFNHKAEEVLSSPAAVLEKKEQPAKGKQEIKAITTGDIPVRDTHLETRSQTAEKLHNDQIFVSVEREPRFKGGMLAFYQFLAANLQYPPQMMRYNVQGKVIITLTIEKDGSVSDVKSLRDIGYGSAEEAIRVLKKSPRWEPGYQNGEPVRVRYTLPISFDLVREKNSSDTISKVSFRMSENNTPQPQTAKENNPDTSRRVTLVAGGQFDFMSNALYLLDGKAIPGMNGVDPNNVKSIRIIKHPDKDNVYVLLYGERAINGVVLIESKDTNNKPAK
ncbi:MAG: energy transducer TonB [Bacteroidetes bacterium]|nr:energy transducer TonB [Bacteroidota bacterium]